MADTEREAFEAWTTGPEGAWIDAAVWRDSDGNYGELEIAREWEIWQAASRAALASRPAEVDDEDLPPLPAPDVKTGHFFPAGAEHAGRDYFTAEQYRQGQRDAVAADRARRAAGGGDR